MRIRFQSRSPDKPAGPSSQAVDLRRSQYDHNTNRQLVGGSGSLQPCPNLGLSALLPPWSVNAFLLN
jgi:hypothetical protein